MVLKYKEITGLYEEDFIRIQGTSVPNATATVPIHKLYTEAYTLTEVMPTTHFYRQC